MLTSGRMIVAVAATGLALAGCDRKAGTTTNTTTTTATTPAASATATPAPGFTPPTSMSRAEFGGKVERRFHKLDKNGDDKLTRDELPGNRADKILRRADRNGDGVIDAAEWSQAMLARFDKRDTNHDGNLTSDEKGGRRGEGGGRRHGGGRRDRGGDGGNGGGGFDDSDGDEVDNGM